MVKQEALAHSLDDDPFGWVGHTLEGRYAVEAVVGEGGFAVVYRGHHKGLDGAVAIKCLKIPRKMAGEERERFLRSFLDEGKLLHRLSRANACIVQALDVGATTAPNGSWTPYLVLEWLDGETLEDELRARVRNDVPPRSLGEAIALLEPAASALATAHAEGIAHRDVKPANLFLCTVAGKRVLKVVDFGIAKVIGESTDLQRAHEATGTSLHAFSPRYGAPEQFDRRFGATGPWTDVFALALVFVEVVSGRFPMQGDSAQLFVAASNVQHRPTLRAFDIDAGDAVEEVLLRALAVDPKERYTTADAFWDALKKAAVGLEAVQVKRQGTATVRASVAPPPSYAMTSAPPAEKPVTRRVDPLAPTVPSLPGDRILPQPEAPVVHRPQVTTAMSAVDEVTRPPPSRSPFLWIGLAAAAALGGGYWLLSGPSTPQARVRAAAVPSATASAVAPSAETSPARPPEQLAIAEPAPPVLAATCSSGLVPYKDTSVGFNLCIPDELRDIAAVDGTLRTADLQLKIIGGPLKPPDTTLESMFEHDKGDTEDGREVMPGKTEKSSNDFSLYGTLEGEKFFFERVVTTTNRFVKFQLVYSDAQRKTLEAKLPRMNPTFSAITTGGTAKTPH